MVAATLPLFSTYGEDHGRVEPPRIGDRFTWLGETWICIEVSDHCSGRVPVVAVALSDSRVGVPFADEVHTILRRTP